MFLIFILLVFSNELVYFFYFFKEPDFLNFIFWLTTVDSHYLKKVILLSLFYLNYLVVLVVVVKFLYRTRGDLLNEELASIAKAYLIKFKSINAESIPQLISFFFVTNIADNIEEFHQLYSKVMRVDHAIIDYNMKALMLAKQTE